MHQISIIFFFFFYGDIHLQFAYVLASIDFFLCVSYQTNLHTHCDLIGAFLAVRRGV